MWQSGLNVVDDLSYCSGYWSMFLPTCVKWGELCEDVMLDGVKNQFPIVQVFHKTALCILGTISVVTKNNLFSYV